MSKALLIIDMPENGCMDCTVCKDLFLKTICGITGNGVSGNHERGGFPEECPLKPVPEKKIECEFKGCSKKCCEHGWNSCIDEIIGGNE